uniref:Uncharacterized protein n=1 Tax=Cucumis melo TaxID=3656 RepID=A0A9I9E2F9_CUCME
MEDSSEDEREMLPEVRKKSFVPRWPTTMSELVLVRNSGQNLPIQFNEHRQPVGATSKKMQSYISACVRQQIPITYNSWKEVPNELKDKIYDCISDELVATNKNEDILTDALGSKEHGGREKMCHKEEDDSRCKSDKKRSNHSRSSIGSINIDLDADEDTPTNKGVEGTQCQLSIGSINNIVAVATIVEDNIGCLKSSSRRGYGRKFDYTQSSEGKDRDFKSSIGHAVNNMKDVDMIRIPMNELIFGSDKFVYLAREDLLHYCDMVEIGYMCILAYITCLWDKCDCARNFFVIDQSKISSHIKDRDLRSRNLANQLEAVNLEQKVLIPYNTGGLKIWQAKHNLQRYRSTPKWRPVKFNTKNAYRQEEIDEIRTKWAAFVS